MRKLERTFIQGLMMLSFIVCLVIGGRRIAIEGQEQGVRIGIRYEDILNMSQEKDQEIGDLLIQFKEAGATTLFIKENTLLPQGKGSLDNEAKQGHIRVLAGYEEANISKAIPQIKAPFIYIVVKEPAIAERIKGHLTHKGIPNRSFNVEDETYIEVRDESSLTTIGVGFPEEGIQVGANLGYEICLGLRAWPKGLEETAAYIVSEINKLPSIGPLYFLEDRISDYDSPELIKLVAEKGVFFREFLAHKQKGFIALVKSVYNHTGTYPVVREFGDDNLKSFSTLDTLNRYKLALKERKDRAFLFNLPQQERMAIQDEESLLELITSFKKEAEKAGYEVGVTQQYDELKPGARTVSTDILVSFIAGLGAIGFFVLLMDDFNRRGLGYGLAIVGIIGYSLILYTRWGLGLKLMALFGAIICPVYAVVTEVKPQKRDYIQGIGALLKICLISFGGGLTIIGTLSRTSYSLGIDLFSGVKLAYLLPILGIVLILFYKYHEEEKHSIRELMQCKVTYLALIIMGILTLFFLIYAIRSGNSAEVPHFEKIIRDTLTKCLGVRPRTKEFLIGYPFLLLVLCWGYQDKYLPLVALGAIGPVSLVNTYAHIHTPLLISLLRSSYGIILGIAIGLVLLVLTNWVISYFQKHYPCHKE
ncbi:hypothetical protein CS063_06130 [Sporanaerobium hydrogeniformans]|uniref:Uncharacterized protein n=1 Tax=Sporanaerobium hydrogeniformans TaxID=3072179 RepID=A0AC61DFI8_9FIRM|nr:DUF5693 family protein [Sporanaerobium hydrogeniformans]PHV71267.1 hypothetical protein CS063_06130 [Sporanaerobium hydrogeniformans]